MMIALEGPDMCGKTQIGRELSNRLGIAYYKNASEWNVDVKTTSYFKNVLTYGSTIQTDLLCQIKPNVVLDRYYPSEWVYSRVFDRPTNKFILEKVDEMFASAGGKIVLCRRKSYAGLQDDLHEYINSEMLEKLDHFYDEFSHWTKCNVMSLWVDDHDLNRQVYDVIQWIAKNKA